ncbi:polysaccharide pyruvyl transferase family protein [Vibrio paucivorans]
MKIAICGLIKSENIGELFIAKSLEYIIENEIREVDPSINIEFVRVDLLGRNDEIVEATGSFEKRLANYYNYSAEGIRTEKVFLNLKKRGHNTKSKALQNLIARIRHSIWTNGQNYKKRLNSYFEHKLQGVDFIVIDGAGLLEYSYNEYHWPLSLISEYAENHNLNVVYNSIGRAGAFDERDFGSKVLKKALQSPSVKSVSARDNPMAVQACAGGKHEVKLLADAAFWMKEAYQIPSDVSNGKIGIGLIRGNSLQGYGVNFGTKQWVKLFSGIANELKARGYKFEFFTNGLPADTKLGRKVLKALDLPDEYLVERPLGDDELVDTINQYDGIVTCRMHSSIAAFTMNVPSVILSWNDKVEKMMEIIGYPERAIKYEQLEAKYIVDMLERSLKEGISDEKLLAMKDKARESVLDYLPLILDCKK